MPCQFLTCADQRMYHARGIAGKVSGLPRRFRGLLQNLIEIGDDGWLDGFRRCILWDKGDHFGLFDPVADLDG